MGRDREVAGERMPKMGPKVIMGGKGRIFGIKKNSQLRGWGFHSKGPTGTIAHQLQIKGKLIDEFRKEDMKCQRRESHGREEEHTPYLS